MKDVMFWNCILIKYQKQINLIFFAKNKNFLSKHCVLIKKESVVHCDGINDTIEKDIEFIQGHS